MAKTINRRLAELIDSSGQLTAGKLPNAFITTAHYSANSITDAKLHTSFSLPASALTARDTGDLSEGSNLYYTDARVGTYISGDRSYGNITTTGYIAGPASMVIDPAGVGDNTGTVVIAGNLQVDGTTTTINSTTVSIDDLNFTIASDAADSSAANGAGITIGGASATMLYTHATTSFDFNKPVNVTGNIGVSGTVDGVDIAARDAILTSTTTTAGAALPKAGGTLTGTLTSNSLIKTTGDLEIASTQPRIILDRADGAYTWNIYNGDGSGNFPQSTFNIANNAGTSVLTALDSGNVGIGNTNPQTNLTIGSAQGNSLEFTYDSTNGYRNIISNYWNSSTDTRMDFNIGRTGNVAPVPVMSVGYGGNVGIGTISPNAKLELNVASGDGLLIKSADISTIKMKGSGGVTDWGFATTKLAAGDFGIYASNSAGGDPITAGTARMYFKSDGNVGIGDTSPSLKLNVYQSTVGIGAADFHHVNGNRILVNPSYNYYDAYNHIFRGLNGTSTHMTIDVDGRLMLDATKNYGSGSTFPTYSGIGGYIHAYVNGSGTTYPRYLDIASIGSNGAGNGGNIRLIVNQNSATAGDVVAQFSLSNGSSVKNRLNVGDSMGGPTPANTLSVRMGESSTTGGPNGGNTYFPIVVGGGTHLAGRAFGIGFDPEGYGYRNKVAILVEGDNQGYSHGKLHFALNSTIDSQNVQIADSKMTILKTGNVGIGTTAPSFKLVVAHNGRNGMEFVPNTDDAGTNIIQNYNRGTAAYTPLRIAGNSITLLSGTNAEHSTSIDTTGQMRTQALLLEGTSPIRFIANGSENTYMRSVIYAHQNNTGSNFNNGMHIEMGRLTDSSTAEVRAFVVGARGGQSSFKVTERAAGVTQADGDYLVKMYDLNADGFIDLSTGQATPLVKTRITSYGTNYFTPAGTTATNQAMVSVGDNLGAKAGVLNIRSTSSTAGGIRHRMAGGTQYLNVASTHTGSGSLPYWHIKTNIYYYQNIMFVARVHGYAYGNSGHIIDMQRSGYAYGGSSTALVGFQFVNNGSFSGATLDPYYTSAGQLCFRAYAGASSYYTGWAFDIKMQSPTGYNHDFVVDTHHMNATSGNYYT